MRLVERLHFVFHRRAGETRAEGLHGVLRGVQLGLERVAVACCVAEAGVLAAIVFPARMHSGRLRVPKPGDFRLARLQGGAWRADPPGGCRA